jgi:hypothetical protein
MERRAISRALDTAATEVGDDRGRGDGGERATVATVIVLRALARLRA